MKIPLGSMFALMLRDLRESQRTLIPFVWQAGTLGMVFIFLNHARAMAIYRGSPGLTFFEGLSTLNMIALTLLAIIWFSSAVSEEREADTLGLLRMSSMSWFSLLLGKSTSRMIRCFLYLIAQIPLALLAVMLGGITAEQVLQTYLLIVSLLILFANIALVCSTLSRRTSVTASLAAITIVFICVGPLAIGAILDEFGHHALSQWTSQNHPAVQFKAIFKGTFPACVPYCMGAGIALFLLAWLIVKLFDGEAEVASTTKTANQTRAPRRPKGRPITWREMRFAIGTGRLLLAPIVAVTVIGIFASANFHRFTLDEALATSGAFVFYLILLEGAAHISGALGCEKRNRTLAVLLTLPQSPGTIIRAKMLARLLALLPAPLIFGLCAMASDHLQRAIANVLRNEKALLYFASAYLVTLSTGAFLSVRMNRWPTLLAIVCTLIVQLGLIALCEEFLRPGEFWIYTLAAANATFSILCFQRFPRDVTRAAAGE